MTSSKITSPTSYETDYLQWLETTLQQLRSRDDEKVDWQNLIAEIEDLGKRDRGVLC